MANEDMILQELTGIRELLQDLLQLLRERLPVSTPQSEYTVLAPICNCGLHHRGESTCGWYCPAHGQQF
jgi:hypothetical protein